MIAIDTNILVYAHRREATAHRDAFELLRDLAEARVPWAIPWPCLYEFYSVVTNRKIWKETASTPSEAWAQMAAWQRSPSLRIIGETDAEGFFALLERVISRPRVRGPIVHDARVAALCIAHGVECLLTRDRDFSLFPELRTRNPFS